MGAAEQHILKWVAQGWALHSMLRVVVLHTDARAVATGDAFVFASLPGCAYTLHDCGPHISSMKRWSPIQQRDNYVYDLAQWCAEH